MSHWVRRGNACVVQKLQGQQLMEEFLKHGPCGSWHHAQLHCIVGDERECDWGTMPKQSWVMLLPFGGKTKARRLWVSTFNAGRLYLHWNHVQSQRLDIALYVFCSFFHAVLTANKVGANVAYFNWSVCTDWLLVKWQEVEKYIVCMVCSNKSLPQTL